MDVKCGLSEIAVEITMQNSDHYAGAGIVFHVLPFADEDAMFVAYNGKVDGFSIKGFIEGNFPARGNVFEGRSQRYGAPCRVFYIFQRIDCRL